MLNQRDGNCPDVNISKSRWAQRHAVLRLVTLIRLDALDSIHRLIAVRIITRESYQLLHPRLQLLTSRW